MLNDLHAGERPVRRLTGRVLKRQGDDLFGDISAKRRDARGARLIPQEAIVRRIEWQIGPWRSSANSERSRPGLPT
jgi:hypothetical protein